MLPNRVEERRFVRFPDRCWNHSSTDHYLGQTLVPLPSDRKAGQLLVPRDDIPPPPPVLVTLGVCRLRLARICSSSYPSSSLKGAVWEGRREFFLGGIRKSIVTGRPIRDDVRSAAHEVWKEACRRTQSLLADPAQAADVMEDSVARVSRYLDRIGAPSSSPKNGLLLLAFSRALRRLAAKSRRLEPAGGAVELSSRAVDHGLEPPSRRATGSGKHRSKTERKKQRGLGSQSGRLQLGGSCPGTRNVSGDGSQQLLARSQRFEKEVPIDEKQRDRIDHRLSQEHSKHDSFRRGLTPQEYQYRRSILGCDTQIVFRLKLLRRRTVFLFHLGFVLRLFFLGFPHG